ncbi:cell division protein FtsH, partial [Lactobacillus sp. XV13L]|nr:cell division protein FtsH [Lactobacillus sp. XV13L]
VKELLNEAHAKAVEIVKNNREKHRIIAEALLKYETLDEKQIMSLYTTGKMPEKAEQEYPSESKALTYEEAKAAAEKKENTKATSADSQGNQTDAAKPSEADAKPETPLEKNQQTEERNPENPEKMEFPRESAPSADKEPTSTAPDGKKAAPQNDSDEEDHQD